MKAILIKHTKDGIQEEEVQLEVGSNVRGLRFKRDSFTFSLKDVQEIVHNISYRQASGFISDLSISQTKD